MVTIGRVILILAVLLGVALLATTKWAQGSTATEDWSDLSDWTSSGCGIGDWQRQVDGNLLVKAYSCGLYYNQAFSRDSGVSIEAMVRCRPATEHDRCWAGVKIGNVDAFREGGDDYPICEFGNENVAYHVWTPYIENLVGLVNCYAYYHGPYAPWTWHTLKVEWRPTSSTHGYYLLSVDGLLRSSVYARLTGYARPKIECVAAVQSGPGDGSLAECEFGPVTIAGDAPSTPSPTPTPTPAPQPWWCKWIPQWCNQYR